jgi:DNA-binding HxlR family transcriptional regulator
MDKRTQQLLTALAHPGADIVFQLVSNGAMTEEELLQAVDDTSQSTMNRRLKLLGELGVLTRASGPRQYKDRPWAIAVAEAADSFLGAALELSRAVARKEEADRAIAAGELRKARKRRRALSVAKDRRGANDSA